MNCGRNHDCIRTYCVARLESNPLTKNFSGIEFSLPDTLYPQASSFRTNCSFIRKRSITSCSASFWAASSVSFLGKKHQVDVAGPWFKKAGQKKWTHPLQGFGGNEKKHECIPCFKSIRPKSNNLIKTYYNKNTRMILIEYLKSPSAKSQKHCPNHTYDREHNNSDIAPREAFGHRLLADKVWYRYGRVHGTNEVSEANGKR